MKIFEHTYKENNMWRGWLKNGQSLEVVWNRHGWEFAGGIHISKDENDMGDRYLSVYFWRFCMFIPLGKTQHPWPPMDGPRWSVSASKEFGLVFNWGHRRKSFDWPWSWHTLAYEKQVIDNDEGAWVDVFNHDAKEHTQSYPYRYTLRNGTVQHVTATVSKRRHVITYRGLRLFPIYKWIKESIDVEFSAEIGEETGSWKGGCVGCGYDIRKGETMLDALRRMEAERRF